MHFVTSCFGHDYLAFLAVLLSSIRQTNPQAPVTVIYSDLPDWKRKAVAAQNPNARFVLFSDLPRTSGTNRRIGQKMDLWAAAYDLVDSDNIIFLDCDMIIRENLENIFDEMFDIFVTVKSEDIPINTGFVAIRKSSSLRNFIHVWVEKNNYLCEDQVRLANACSQAGGADQFALLDLLDTWRPQTGRQKVFLEGKEIDVLLAPCSIYNETALTSLSGPAKVLHYKGRWHRILLKGGGYEEKKSENPEYFFDMLRLWQRMLRQEEKQIGCRLLPWKARYRLAKAKLAGRLVS